MDRLAYSRTMFGPGKDYPLTGRNGTATASVRVINEKVNEIIYKNTEGKVVQLLINTLSADNNTIEVTYDLDERAGTSRNSDSTATYSDQRIGPRRQAWSTSLSPPPCPPRSGA